MSTANPLFGSPPTLEVTPKIPAPACQGHFREGLTLLLPIRKMKYTNPVRWIGYFLLKLTVTLILIHSIIGWFYLYLEFCVWDDVVQSWKKYQNSLPEGTSPEELWVIWKTGEILNQRSQGHPEMAAILKEMDGWSAEYYRPYEEGPLGESIRGKSPKRVAKLMADWAWDHAEGVLAQRKASAEAVASEFEVV